MDCEEQEKHLKKTIEMKQYSYEEIARELRAVKSDYERQTTLMEQTMNDQMHSKNQHEMKLTQQIDKMASELAALKQQKDYSDKLVAERLKQIKDIETGGSAVGQ